MPYDADAYFDSLADLYLKRKDQLERTRMEGERLQREDERLGLERELGIRRVAVDEQRAQTEADQAAIQRPGLVARSEVDVMQADEFKDPVNQGLRQRGRENAAKREDVALEGDQTENLRRSLLLKWATEDRPLDMAGKEMSAEKMKLELKRAGIELTPLEESLQERLKTDRAQRVGAEQANAQNAAAAPLTLERMTTDNAASKFNLEQGRRLADLSMDSAKLQNAKSELEVQGGIIKIAQSLGVIEDQRGFAEDAQSVAEAMLPDLQRINLAPEGPAKEAMKLAWREQAISAAATLRMLRRPNGAQEFSGYAAAMSKAMKQVPPDLDKARAIVSDMVAASVSSPQEHAAAAAKETAKPTDVILGAADASSDETSVDRAVRQRSEDAKNKIKQQYADKKAIILRALSNDVELGVAVQAAVKKRLKGQKVTDDALADQLLNYIGNDVDISDTDPRFSVDRKIKVALQKMQDDEDERVLGRKR